jgi:hypothetical protein
VPQTHSEELVTLRPHARSSAKCYDLFLAAISLAWIRGTGSTDAESLDRLRAVVESGDRERADEG